MKKITLNRWIARDLQGVFEDEIFFYKKEPTKSKGIHIGSSELRFSGAKVDKILGQNKCLPVTITIEARKK